LSRDAQVELPPPLDGGADTAQWPAFQVAGAYRERWRATNGSQNIVTTKPVRAKVAGGTGPGGGGALFTLRDENHHYHAGGAPAAAGAGEGGGGSGVCVTGVEWLSPSILAVLSSTHAALILDTSAGVMLERIDVGFVKARRSATGEWSEGFSSRARRPTPPVGF
jgi:hypothetical protein